MKFKVGQKVVCVNNRVIDGTNMTFDHEGLHVQDIYTVRGDAGPSWIDGASTIHVQEIERGPCMRTGRVAVGFYEWRFRPLVYRKTEHKIAEKV